MMIYILNLLHENLRLNVKSNVGTVIINDAAYIASFAGINKNTEISQINNKLMNILEIIKKYKVSAIDTLEIFEIMIGNEYNDWIFNKFYVDMKKENYEKLILPLIVNDILANEKEVVLNYISKFSYNVQNLIMLTLFNSIEPEEKKVINHKLHEVS